MQKKTAVVYFMRVQHVTKQAYTRLPLPRCTNIIVLQDVLQLCLYTTVTAVDRHPPRDKTRDSTKHDTAKFGLDLYRVITTNNEIWVIWQNYGYLGYMIGESDQMKLWLHPRDSLNRALGMHTNQRGQ